MFGVHCMRSGSIVSCSNGRPGGCSSSVTAVTYLFSLFSLKQNMYWKEPGPHKQTIGNSG